MSEDGLSHEIENLLRNLGAFRVGFADPNTGFEQTLKGCHPRDVMSDCGSVLVYAFNIGLDYYEALDYEHNNIRLGHLYRDWTALQLITFLRKKKHDATEVPRDHADEKNRIARLSFKQAAYEAGIGVFGKPSIIITPEYGPRANLGVVLTDAVLKPSRRMQGFSPCQNCDICAKVCPVNAITSDKSPPTGFDRGRCIGFVDWLKEKTNQQVKLCGLCYNMCPAGKLVKNTLKIKRWMTFGDLNAKEQIKLASQFSKS